MEHLEQLQMVITTEDGEVKTRTFRDVADELDDYDFIDSLRDFVFLHIGHSFIFEDFSPTTLRQIEDAVKAYNHKDEETDAEGETDAEETPDTAEDAPKEFSVAVEHAPDEELVYFKYSAEELLDLLRTDGADGLTIHVYTEV